MNEHMKWMINEQQANMSVREFLQHIARFSKRLTVKAKSADGKILVNGTLKTVRYVLKEGDRLEIVLPEWEPEGKMIPENIPLKIVYEDDHILLLDKQAGIAVIPSRHHPSGTVANGILHHYLLHRLKSTVHIVTRLDKDTSGLMLVAKNPYSHSLLSNMQRDHKIARKYTAIVSGYVEQHKGTIDQPIGRKEGSIIERTIRPDGRQAITHFTVKERFNKGTVVEIRLETGRTHQIRVHFSAMGHPLIGDDLYGKTDPLLIRQALHCSEIAFMHPFLQQSMHFTSPLPSDLSGYMAAVFKNS